MTRLAVILAALALAAPVYAAEPFASSWAHWYNQQAALHHDPLRIIEIKCAAKRTVHSCDVAARYKSVVRCVHITVAASGRILTQKRFGCPTPAMWWTPDGVGRRLRS